MGIFQKLSLGSETSDMTFEELGEMFEGDFAYTLHVDGGPSGQSSICWPGSEDPHRCAEF